jgi:hypothetical protein
VPFDFEVLPPKSTVVGHLDGDAGNLSPRERIASERQAHHELLVVEPYVRLEQVRARGRGVAEWIEMPIPGTVDSRVGLVRRVARVDGRRTATGVDDDHATVARADPTDTWSSTRADTSRASPSGTNASAVSAAPGAPDARAPGAAPAARLRVSHGLRVPAIHDRALVDQRARAAASEREEQAGRDRKAPLGLTRIDRVPPLDD